MIKPKEFKELDEVDLVFTLHEKISDLTSKLAAAEGKVKELEQIIERLRNSKNMGDIYELKYELLTEKGATENE